MEDRSPFLKNPNALILGDFNAHHEKWGSCHNDCKGIILVNLLKFSNAYILNDGQPTYIDHSGFKSCIDLSIVSQAMALQTNWGIVNNPMGSDHLPITLKINEAIDTDVGTGPRWNIEKANWVRYAKEIDSRVAGDRFPMVDANGTYKYLVDLISSSADEAIPLIKPNPNPRHRLPFWNSDIKQALRNRNKAYNKWKRNNTLENWINFKHEKATAQRIIRQSAKTYWENWCGTINEGIKDGVVWKMAKIWRGMEPPTEPKL
jgi:hypothetical protein